LEGIYTEDSSSIKWRACLLPGVLDFEDTGGAQLVGLAGLRHGAERRPAQVEVDRLVQARAAGALVGDDDGHWVAGASLVARAFHLLVMIIKAKEWFVMISKSCVSMYIFNKKNSCQSRQLDIQCIGTHLEARAATHAGLVDGRAAGGDHGREGRLVDGALVATRTTYMYKASPHVFAETYIGMEPWILFS